MAGRSTRDIVDLGAMYGRADLGVADDSPAILTADVTGGAAEDEKESEADDERATGDTDGEGPVSATIMEAQLRPAIIAIFDRLADIDKKFSKLQARRVAALANRVPLSGGMNRRRSYGPRPRYKA